MITKVINYCLKQLVLFCFVFYFSVIQISVSCGYLLLSTCSRITQLVLCICLSVKQNIGQTGNLSARVPKSGWRGSILCISSNYYRSSLWMLSTALSTLSLFHRKYRLAQNFYVSIPLLLHYGCSCSLCLCWVENAVLIVKNICCREGCNKHPHVMIIFSTGSKNTQGAGCKWTESCKPFFWTDKGYQVVRSGAQPQFREAWTG